MIEAYIFECIANTYKAANGSTYFQGQKFHLSPKSDKFAFFDGDSCFKKTRKDVPDEDARLVGLAPPDEPQEPENQPEQEPAGDGERTDEDPENFGEDEEEHDAEDGDSEESVPTDLSELDLEEAEYAALLKNGISSVEQLEDFDTEKKLVALKDIGEARAKSILEAMKGYRKR